MPLLRWLLFVPFGFKSSGLLLAGFRSDVGNETAPPSLSGPRPVLIADIARSGELKKPYFTATTHGAWAEYLLTSPRRLEILLHL